MRFKALVAKSLLVALPLTLIPAFASSAALECPDTWNIAPSQGQISLIQNNDIPSDFSSTNFYSTSDIQNAVGMGLPFLVIKNYLSPMPPAFNEKILSGGRDVAVTGQWKISTDGKNWRGFSEVLGDLLPSIVSKTYDGSLRNRTKVDWVWSVAGASRQGLTPNTKLAFEIKVDVSGCKQKVFYENQTSVPNYTVPTKSLDSLIDAFYVVKPNARKINFVTQKSCNETFSSFISHLKDASSKSQVWTIQNTRRNLLDLGWSLTEPENFICTYDNGELPGYDLRVLPTYGDSCLIRTNPFTGKFTYKTTKYPCSVSVDLVVSGSGGTFEVSKFEIVKPKSSSKGTSTKKSNTCISGKLSKKVSGTNPQCSKGYKLQ
jgi:hypothetical protein